MPTGRIKEPLLSRRFHVEIQGIQQAIFTECSGLQVESEVLRVQEGGRNNFVHILPGPLKVANVTLKWGITDSRELWDWFKELVNGRIERKNVHIITYDQEGTEKIRWTLRNAIPIKWVGPNFRAEENAVGIESLELAHEGLDGLD